MTRVVAKYIRVSREDESAGESESVAGQRLLLDSFLAAAPELAGQETIEIIDDGCSGTGFDRPGIRRLLALARQGEIDCILVKDFSRFGRNYIEVGNYLEQIFPACGLRFISVNDRFDSVSAAGSGLENAFQFLLAELYSRDLSVKVRSARRVKMQEGAFTSPYAIFGYRKAVDDKNRLEIDEAAAEIVREIFALACRPLSPTGIARCLDEAERPTPMAYKQANGCVRSWSHAADNFWTKEAVRRILRDERYIGKMVSGKRLHRRPGERATVLVPQALWTTVEATHPPLVNREIFAQAQLCMALPREGQKSPPQKRPLSGRVICAGCGHLMRRREAHEPYYICEAGRYLEKEGCGGRIAEAVLLQAAETIANRFAALASGERPLTMLREAQTAKSMAAEDAVKQAKAGIRRAHDRKNALSGQVRSGQIDRTTFERLSHQAAVRAEHFDALLLQAETQAEAARQPVQLCAQLGELCLANIRVRKEGMLEICLRGDDLYAPETTSINNDEARKAETVAGQSKREAEV